MDTKSSLGEFSVWFLITDRCSDENSNRDEYVLDNINDEIQAESLGVLLSSATDRSEDAANSKSSCQT